MTSDVVVEIREHVDPARGSCREPVAPRVKLVVAVRAAVPFYAVESDVDEWANRDALGRRAFHVVQAQRHLVPVKQRKHTVVVPAWVAKLDCMNPIRPYAVEILEEILQTAEVDRPPRGQLIQDRTEMRPEVPGIAEEPHEWVVRVFQLLHMGKETARLDRVQEVTRRSLAPFFESCHLGQSVEGVVDLDSIEVQRVMGEPASLGQPSRIEDAPPMAVLPPRAADPDSSTATHNRRAP